MKIIKADNSDEVRKKISDIKDKEAIRNITADIIELATISIQDLLSIYGFWKYLIDKNKDKVYITNKHTPVYKHKETLEKLHECEILLIDKDKRQRQKK